jgi:hypothetical protein
VNYSGGGWISLCVDRASVSVEDGDSGGPVFKVLDDVLSTARMAGIVSGRVYDFLCGCWDLIFTPMHIVHSEFPELEWLPQ